MKQRVLLPFFLLAGLILLVGLACGTVTTPTAQPPIQIQPTQPPPVQIQPTPLPTPTPTDTPIPTPTPYLAATQMAERTTNVIAQMVKFDLSTDTGHLGWYQTEPVAIRLNGFGNEYEPFAENVDVSDFALYTEVTWKTDSWPICGLWFRSDKTYKQGEQYRFYFLRISGLPAWDIEYWKNDKWITTVTDKIRYSDTLDLDDGATNKFLLVAEENKFTVYINGHKEGNYFDWSERLSSGRFAFTANQDSGDTTCTFANTWLWTYK